MLVFFFKQKTAYEMRISDWSSDVCSSDLAERPAGQRGGVGPRAVDRPQDRPPARAPQRLPLGDRHGRHAGARGDRKSVVQGKSVSVRVALGGRRIIKKKKTNATTLNEQKAHNNTKPKSQQQRREIK